MKVYERDSRGIVHVTQHGKLIGRIINHKRFTRLLMTFEPETKTWEVDEVFNNENSAREKLDQFYPDEVDQTM